MKKIQFLSIVALIAIILFPACNNSGSKDANDEQLKQLVLASQGEGDYGKIYPREAWDFVIGNTNLFSFFQLFWHWPTDTGSSSSSSTSSSSSSTSSSSSGTTSSSSSSSGSTSSSSSSSTTSSSSGTASSSSSGSTSSSTSSSSSGSGTTGSAKLVFTGDVMLARNVKTAVTSHGGNYSYPFQYVTSYFNGADLVVINLESIITNTGIANASQVAQGTAFRADPAAINGLKSAGIDVVNVANNHAFDYARAGFDDCISRLKAAGITIIGGGTFDEAYTPKIITINGVKIALLGTTLVGDETTIRAQQNDTTQRLVAQTGVAWFYSKYMEPAIVNAKHQADIVVVSFHEGTEYATLPDATQDRFAHYCIDQGANLVIGHHPHVIQPVMQYMKGYIAQSLGNFVYDDSNTNTQKGMVLEVVIQNKKIAQVNRKYVQINSNYQPVLQ